MAMPDLVSVPGNELQRRDKFRAYMQAFNPTAPPQRVIQAGLVYEDLRRFLFRNLGGRADLEPGSQQLLVGGVGSGKKGIHVAAVRRGVSRAERP